MRIRSMRNACYNPITHRISVSNKLVRELPADLLAILIAHETCHASQRHEILADALRIQSWPLVVLMLTGVATIGSMLADALHLAVSVGIIGNAITYVTVRISSKRWEAAYLRREMLADAFANKHCGNERGSAELLVRCSTLEDEGRMTAEAHARIAALPA